MTAIPAYPLQWPSGWKRTPEAARAYGHFGKTVTRYSSCVHADGSRSTWKGKDALTIADAVTRVRAELGRMGLADDDIVISSDLQLRLDGFPRGSQREPDDCGVAVYWQDIAGNTRCMAIDRYQRVADNLAAIAATLNAMRAIERHGGAEILDRAFSGFVALEDQRTPWWEVLGVDSAARWTEIEAAWKRRRATAHPDKGGSSESFDAVVRAYEQAGREHGRGE